MSKFTFKEEIQTAINSLISFDAADRSHKGSQTEYAKTNIREWRKACQAVIKLIGKLSNKQRDALLIASNLATLAGRKNKDTRIAWLYLGGKNGLKVVKLIEADKLGEATTIRGIVAKAKKEIEPPQSRPNATKAGQGKKQVSFTAGKDAKAAKATTTQAQLEVLEAAAKAHGFDLYTFFEAWSVESKEPAQKLVANG